MNKRKCFSCFSLLLLVALVLGGCGGSDYSDAKEGSYSSGYSTDSYMAEEMAMAEESTAYNASYEDVYEIGSDEEFSKSSNGTETTQAETVTDNRKLIKTVNMDVETDEFDKLIANIDSKIKALSGYAESKNIGGRSYNDVTSNRFANIVVRIPSTKLDEFVSAVENYSNITNKSESVDDVTLQYVDMEAHIESLRIEQDRLNELLMQAEDIDTIIVLQNRLTEVRYQLESYESQLRAMQNKVDYSTIYLYIQEVIKYTPEPAYKLTVWDRIGIGLADSFENIGVGLTNLFVDFVISLPYIVVICVFLGIIGLIVLLIVKISMKKSKAREAIKMKEREENLKRNEEYLAKKAEAEAKQENSKA